MENCLFCRIVAGSLPATIVYRTESAVAFADRTPQAPTHVLIVPTSHCDGFQDLPAGDAAGLVATVQETARLLGVERAYRLVTNQGAGAGQSVFHLHFHLLAGRPLQWPPG
ncbi:MAG: HIT domain-containing protein [Candidatus Sericytochromatia bacterium]|nr:HIT domain-containing protein [Candidatus Sericytochromatia bacterium]